MLRGQFPDGGGIGHDICAARDFPLAMPDHNRWEPILQYLTDLFDIAQDNAVGIQGLQARPHFLQPSRLPVKDPGPVMARIIGDAAQQTAPRRAGGFNQQDDLGSSQIG